MKRILSLLLVIIASHQALSWGKTGHRTVGQIAENNLTKKAAKRIKSILGDESLALCGTWMDDIKSDSTFDYTDDWHWVSVPDSLTYEQSLKNPNGDVIETIYRLINELKSGKLDKSTELNYFRMLVHLIGDIHQPLHVGRGEDRGGNKIIVKWFGQPSNIHRVWDSQIIDDFQLSYTELCNSLPKPSTEQISIWQSSKVIDWANESKSYRSRIYDFPADGFIGYSYIYKNKELVKLRINQAGYRLAGILNEIYG